MDSSDHWISASVTIFVAVLRYLNISVWNKPPISLKKGQLVSILCAPADGGGDVHAYGEVASDQDNRATTICVCKFKDSEECYVACEHIKVRDVVSVPLIVISDSKLHDTYFVRHFLSNVLLGQNGWLLNQTREPDLSSRVRSINICSDGQRHISSSKDLFIFVFT